MDLCKRKMEMAQDGNTITEQELKHWLYECNKRKTTYWSILDAPSMPFEMEWNISRGRLLFGEMKGDMKGKWGKWGLSTWTMNHRNYVTTKIKNHLLNNEIIHWNRMRWFAFTTYVEYRMILETQRKFLQCIRMRTWWLLCF